MLDIKQIRRQPELFQKVADQKKIDIDISQLLELDERRGSLIGKTEDAQQERNALKTIIAKNPDPDLISKIKKINESIKDYKAQLREVEEQYLELMLQVPAIPNEDPSKLRKNIKKSTLNLLIR